MEYEIDLIEIILQNYKAETEDQKRIKLYLQTHKNNCSEYITKSTKYKERVICLKSICHSIKSDLFSEICQQITK